MTPPSSYKKQQRPSYLTEQYNSQEGEADQEIVTMRTVNAATQGVGFWRWNSPVLYLFGGLAIMFGLIIVALILLACSHLKSERGSSGEQEKKALEKPVCEEGVRHVLVIMAGDTKPTFLAKPTSHVLVIKEV